MACSDDSRIWSSRPIAICAASLVLAAWLGGCSGDVDYQFDDDTPGSGGARPDGGGGTSSGGNPFYGSGGFVPESSGGQPTYDEQECPYVPPPITYHECDPLAEDSGCASYEVCLPYLQSPDQEDGCGTPGYGEICWTAGKGEQGDLCSASGTGCSPGFMCVLGAAGGDRCAKICVPGEKGHCQNGLICGEIDVVGYGVCY